MDFEKIPELPEHLKEAVADFREKVNQQHQAACVSIAMRFDKEMDVRFTHDPWLFDNKFTLSDGSYIRVATEPHIDEGNEVIIWRTKIMFDIKPGEDPVTGEPMEGMKHKGVFGKDLVVPYNTNLKEV